LNVRSATSQILLLPVLLTGTAVAARAVREPIEAIQASREIPEELRLDVGIQVFDPGLPTDEDGNLLPESELEAKKVLPHLRRSEGRYIAFLLRGTLEETGNWGAVRVIPAGLDTVDVTVVGVIMKSTGKELEVRVEAYSSTGRSWFKKKFKGQANAYAYDDDVPETFDPYQNLYNRIANALLAARENLKDDEIRRIRDVSQIRFAADLAPDVYGDHLSVDKKRRYSLEKMPADDDPMIGRVNRIRERDYELIDTLNEYYTDFALRMGQPYNDWREYSYEEEVALKKMRREAMWTQIFGAALIVGGASADVSGVARDAAVVGGAVAIAEGAKKRKESKMHVEALRELAVSFDVEIEPLLIDVEGLTMQLTGSAEAQYADWRRLLRKMFAAETGLPVDLNEEVPSAAETADD